MTMTDRFVRGTFPLPPAPNEHAAAVRQAIAERIARAHREHPQPKRSRRKYRGIHSAVSS